MWDFFQNEILGMQWLRRLMGAALEGLGLDTGSRLWGAVQFFLYDVVKILALLCVLIFLVSFLQSWFPPERTKRILGRLHGLGANCAAALLGTVTPFCSCSSIPLFMGFTSAGLPLGVTFSFLISSPMVDLGSLVLLTGVFGWKVAAAYVLLGLAVAVAGGSLIQRLHMEAQVEDFIRQAAAADVARAEMGLADRLGYAWGQMLSLAKKTAPYVLAGAAVGAVIHNWIPEAFVVGLLGKDSPFGVILAVLAGTPLYADIFGAIPIAEALLAKGAMLGVALSFMMAVTTLSLPSLMLLRKVVKPKLLGVFVAICVAGIVLVGYVFNGIQTILL